MQIIGIILWVVGAIWAIGHGFNIRQMAKTTQSTEHVFELHALLVALSVIFIPILNLSPFHLLWMLPASFVIGLASVIFPLNLLWIPASIYGSLWYVGTRNVGKIHYLAGDYDKAIEAYKETVRRKPNSAEAHFNLGIAYGKMKLYEKAIEAYKETIRLKPKAAEAHCNLGFEYRDLGQYSEAIESFMEATRLNPNYAKAIGNLGLVYVELGDLDNALAQHKVLQKVDKQKADELYSAINAKGE